MQNFLKCFTAVGSGFDSRQDPWEVFKCCFFCPHSVAVVSTQPLTEMSSKEFPWRQSAAGEYSRPGCTECQSKDGSPTFVICRGKAVIVQLSASQVGPHTTDWDTLSAH